VVLLAAKPYSDAVLLVKGSEYLCVETCDMHHAKLKYDMRFSPA
jgi:hypothetical protein